MTLAPNLCGRKTIRINWCILGLCYGIVGGGGWSGGIRVGMHVVYNVLLLVPWPLHLSRRSRARAR